MMEFETFDAPSERLRALRALLQDELTDRQRTILLAAALATILNDEEIALVVSKARTLDRAYSQAD